MLFFILFPSFLRFSRETIVSIILRIPNIERKECSVLTRFHIVDILSVASHASEIPSQSFLMRSKISRSAKLAARNTNFYNVDIIKISAFLFVNETLLFLVLVHISGRNITKKYAAYSFIFIYSHRLPEINKR